MLSAVLIVDRLVQVGESWLLIGFEKCMDTLLTLLAKCCRAIFMAEGAGALQSCASTIYANGFE